MQNKRTRETPGEAPRAGYFHFLGRGAAVLAAPRSRATVRQDAAHSSSFRNPPFRRILRTAARHKNSRERTIRAGPARSSAVFCVPPNIPPTIVSYARSDIVRQVKTEDGATHRDWRWEFLGCDGGTHPFVRPTAESLAAAPNEHQVDSAASRANDASGSPRC